MAQSEADKKVYPRSSTRLDDRHDGKNKRRERDSRKPEDKDGLENRLVQVNRVAKVVKGGRNMSFSALVVVGNKAGRVGVASGKAAEVPDAVEKATANAKKYLITVPMINTTIPHEAVGRFGTSIVLIKPAPEGAGVIAGSSVRAVIELAGYKDVITKSMGSRNKINTVKATIEALKLLKSKEQVATLRGKKLEEI
ncbi:MAG: 30S ribosomal protein S5 [Clostridia bacterium]|nr:30S ribosomal protein S5 [Clostridia bacterium]